MLGIAGIDACCTSAVHQGRLYRQNAKIKLSDFLDENTKSASNE